MWLLGRQHKAAPGWLQGHIPRPQEGGSFKDPGLKELALQHLKEEHSGRGNRSAGGPMGLQAMVAQDCPVLVPPLDCQEGQAPSPAHTEDSDP